jgi:hypothetical protein
MEGGGVRSLSTMSLRVCVCVCEHSTRRTPTHSTLPHSHTPTLPHSPPQRLGNSESEVIDVWKGVMKTIDLSDDQKREVVSLKASFLLKIDPIMAERKLLNLQIQSNLPHDKFATKNALMYIKVGVRIHVVGHGSHAHTRASMRTRAHAHTHTHTHRYAAGARDQLPNSERVC